MTPANRNRTGSTSGPSSSTTHGPNPGPGSSSTSPTTTTLTTTGATTPPAGTHARALIYQGYYPDKTCHQTLVALVLDGDDPAARKTAEAWWDNGEDLGEELDPEDYNADWHPWHEFEGTIDDKCVEGTYRNITEDQVHVRWGPEVLLKVAKMEERMENGAPR